MEAEERGLAEGQAKGRLDALRAMLNKQLALKFGDVSHDQQERLARATDDELERYLERIVTAAAATDVFE